MLIHEWMRYRDKHLARPEGEGEETRPETQEAEAPEAPAEETEETEETEEAEEEKEEGGTEAQMWAEVAALAKEVSDDWAARTAPQPAAPVRRAPTAVLLDLPEQQSRRLQTLLGRQARLPLEVEELLAPARRGPLEPAESREELIERLLDPILSINEAAVLCGVCPASIRRYTNRGVLKCFRTPGNQRRFRLSDVLDFMERQQQEALD